MLFYDVANVRLLNFVFARQTDVNFNQLLFPGRCISETARPQFVEHAYSFRVQFLPALRILRAIHSDLRGALHLEAAKVKTRRVQKIRVENRARRWD